MPDRWNKPDDGISVEEESADPNSLLNFYKQVLALRAATPALQENTIEFPEATWIGAGGLVILRGDAENGVLAIYNFSDETLELTVPNFPLAAGNLVDLLSGEAMSAGRGGQAYTLQVPAKTAYWVAGQ